MAGLFLLGISVIAFAKSNETVKKQNTENSLLMSNHISEGIANGDQSGGGNGNGSGNGGGNGSGGSTGNNGTVFVPIRPPKPPVILY